MRVMAIIKNNHSSWQESFELPEGDDPFNYISNVINYFNSTLKPGETPRFLVKVERYRFSDLSDYDLACEIRALYHEQLAIFTKNTLDEFWGEEAERLLDYFQTYKKFEDFLGASVSMRHTLKLPSFYDALKEAQKRGWKSFRKVDNCLKKEEAND